MIVQSATGQKANLYTVSTRFGQAAVCVEHPKGRVWFLESDAGEHPTWTRDSSKAMTVPEGLAAWSVLNIGMQLNGKYWGPSLFTDGSASAKPINYLPYSIIQDPTTGSLDINPEGNKRFSVTITDAWGKRWYLRTIGRDRYDWTRSQCFARLLSMETAKKHAERIAFVWRTLTASAEAE